MSAAPLRLRLLAGVLSAVLFGSVGGGTRTAVAPPAGCVPANDTLVVPGCRIGPVFHGMHISDLVKAMGDTKNTTSMTCKDTGDRVCSVIYRWPNGISADVSYRDDTRYFRVSKERVHEISTSNPRYATTGGVRVGSSELSVKAALGTPVWETRYHLRLSKLCYSPGLFMTIQNGAVEEIQVYPSKCGK